MENKFKAGDRVNVKGRKDGPFTIYDPMMIQVPTIIKGEFVMVDTPMYKFIPDQNKMKLNFYAYETDLTLAKGKK